MSKVNGNVATEEKVQKPEPTAEQAAAEAKIREEQAEALRRRLDRDTLMATLENAEAYAILKIAVAVLDAENVRRPTEGDKIADVATILAEGADTIAGVIRRHAATLGRLDAYATQTPTGGGHSVARMIHAGLGTMATASDVNKVRKGLYLTPKRSRR